MHTHSHTTTPTPAHTHGNTHTRTIWSPIAIWNTVIHSTVRARALCESLGGRPGFPVANSPHGLCGRKAALNLKHN